MIDLTPLEVRKKKGDFRRTMRGYDPPLVDDFLDLVADRLEQLVRENMALAERASRQDQQVADYRERERALTEALVTAQEMREEIRQQTAREADLARRSAEQEAVQLRAAAQQEVLQLRDEVRREREREEEAVRRLRARQRQFLGKYRAFLERELTELGVMSQALGLASGDAETPSAQTGARPASAASAHRPAAASDPADADLFDEDVEDDPFVDPFAEPFEPEPFEPEPLEPQVSGAPPAAPSLEPEPVEPEPVALHPDNAEAARPPVASGDAQEAAPAADAADAPPADALDLYDALGGEPEAGGVPGPVGLGGGTAGADRRGPPDWTIPGLQLVDDPGSESAVGDAGAEAPEPADARDRDAAAGSPELAAGAADPFGDGGTDSFDQNAAEPQSGDMADTAGDEDEEASRILRNAAAAGYRLPEEDELLLEEGAADDGAAALDGDVDDDDQGWLPTLLEDTK